MKFTLSIKEANDAYDTFVSLVGMSQEQIRIIAESLVRIRPEIAEEMESSIGIEFREIAIEQMEI